MAIKLFEIECITNLQVGSGEANIDIVDIKVERDKGVPCIYSSSLKGALRENYTNKCGVEKAKALFGDEENDGKLKFMQAFLVSMPMRVSFGEKNYVNVCNASTINSINHTYRSLGASQPYEDVDEPADMQIIGKQNYEVEGIKCIGGPLFNGNIFIANDYVFSLIPLPIKIRNNLSEGNKNLWYEEYIPYGSKFIFSVIGDEKDIDDLASSFDPYVQIGGNSSLGFGLCKITSK